VYNSLPHDDEDQNWMPWALYRKARVTSLVRDFIATANITVESTSNSLEGIRKKLFWSQNSPNGCTEPKFHGRLFQDDGTYRGRILLPVTNAQ
jgi:hypothetical protein